MFSVPRWRKHPVQQKVFNRKVVNESIREKFVHVGKKITRVNRNRLFALRLGNRLEAAEVSAFSLSRRKINFPKRLGPV